MTPQYNERTTVTVDVAFFDDSVPAEAVVPSSATYRIDDGSGTVILGETDITSLATTVELEITPTQNRILTDRHPFERRIVTVVFLYGGGSPEKQGTAEYVYDVKNLTGVTT